MQPAPLLVVVTLLGARGNFMDKEKKIKNNGRLSLCPFRFEEVMGAIVKVNPSVRVSVDGQTRGENNKKD